MVGWFEYMQLYKALPLVWKSFLTENTWGTEHKAMYDNFCKRMSYIAYHKLIDDDRALIKYAQCWVLGEILTNFDIVKYQKAFKDLWLITKNSKYRDFQYRLLLGKLVFNYDLKLWKKQDCDLCSFCKRRTETLVHVFADCHIVQTILSKLINEINCYECTVNLETLLFSCVHNQTTHIMNYVTVIFNWH